MRAEGPTRRAVLAAALAAPTPLWAQGFAGLGAEAAGFAMPDPDRALRFPQDYGPHPAFRIEWWYLTANLTGPTGQALGAQFTLFRQSAAPPPLGEGWSRREAWLCHIAVTSADTHAHAERFARGGVGQAGARAAPFEVFLDDWRMGAEGGGAGVSSLHLFAGQDDFGYDLRLDAGRPPVGQGENGYSVKAPGGLASHYFSQPDYTAAGSLRLNGADLRVTGRAWMDREWSSQPLARDQAGWDWFSLHLPGGRKLMAFRLRGAQDFISGNLHGAAGEGINIRLSASDIEMTPLQTATVAGRKIPVRWRVAVPAHDLDLTLGALNPQSWNAGAIPYWEGPVLSEGADGVEGYLEMTGY